MTDFSELVEKPFFVDVVYTYIYTSLMNPSSTPQGLLQQIAQIQRMEPGKLCVMRHGPEGPYYNLQCREKGRTLTRYVPTDQVAVVATHTANYQRFQVLVAQYAQQLIEQTRSERAADTKKNSRRRTSSWPKSKKSNS
jgi:hypothetical protein